MKTALLALLACSCALAAPTIVRDTLTYPTGAPVNGAATIKWDTFALADGTVILGGQQRVTIKNGAINVSLQPGIYSVSYQMDAGQATNEQWIVPATSSVMKLSQVRSYPPATGFMIPVAQLSGAGATTGYVLTFDGAKYTPMLSPANSGASGRTWAQLNAVTWAQLQ